MVNVRRIIELIVLLITIYLLWMTLRWLVLPHLKIFPYIPPEALWAGLYNGIAAGATAAFWMVLTAIICLWIVWRLVKMFIPDNILGIPLGSAITGSTPFREFEQAGIFRLFDEILDVIMRFMPFKETIKGLWAACQNFYRTSLSFVFSKLRREYDVTAAVQGRFGAPGSGGAPTINFSGKTAYDGPDSDPDVIRGDADEQDMHRDVDDVYLQCVDENRIATDADASAGDRLRIAVRNSTVRAMCGAKKMKTYATLMSYRDLTLS
jgi:hypothetical protein